MLSVPPRRVVQAKEMGCLCGGCMGGVWEGVGHELRGGVAEGQGLQAFVPQVRISEFLLSGVGAPFRARSCLRSKRPRLPLAGELLGFSEKAGEGCWAGAWWTLVDLGPGICCSLGCGACELVAPLLSCFSSYHLYLQFPSFFLPF